MEVAPESRRLDAVRWDYDGVYMLIGVAPGMTFRPTKFNPLIRYDTEIGLHWRRDKWRVGAGADAWLLQYARESATVGLEACGDLVVTLFVPFIEDCIGPEMVERINVADATREKTPVDVMRERNSRYEESPK